MGLPGAGVATGRDSVTLRAPSLRTRLQLDTGRFGVALAHGSDRLDRFEAGALPRSRLLALDRMNAYDPEGYPRQHNGLIEMERDTVAAPPFAAEVQ